jgi:hypothetical protein
VFLHEFLLELFFICKYSDIHIQGVPGVTASTFGFNSGANSESKTWAQMTKVQELRAFKVP